MRRKSFLLVVCALACLPSMYGESVQDALNQRYKKQILALRTPFARGNQEFNSAGQPLKTPGVHDWLVYGGIYINKLEVSRDMLRVEGPRVSLTTTADGKAKDVGPVGKPLKVEIRLDHPVSSAEEAQALLERVFYLDNDLRRAVPEYRRPQNPRPGADDPPEEVFHLSLKDSNMRDPNMQAPRPIHTPEPNYSDKARRAKYQGTTVLNVVVDKDGRVSRIRMMRILGMGLDEEAVEAVKTWRFDPARHNGKPVAIEMNIEVSFNLY